MYSYGLCSYEPAGRGVVKRGAAVADRALVDRRAGLEQQPEDGDTVVYRGLVQRER